MVPRFGADVTTQASLRVVDPLLGLLQVRDELPRPGELRSASVPPFHSTKRVSVQR